MHPSFSSFEKTPNAQYILAAFPHGTSSDFRVLFESVSPHILPNTFSLLRSLAASVLFCIPVIREITLATGCIDARKAVAERAVRGGRSILVLPGGEAEQLLTTFGTEKVYVKERKGFVKIGMTNRIPIVPAYVFGSNDLYETSNSFYDARHWVMKKFGVCIPLVKGMFGTACPLPNKLTMCIGEPIFYKCKVDRQPTNAEVEEAHALFIKALVKLFNENKVKLGFGDRELEVV